MKKTLLFVCAAAAMLVSCGGGEGNNNDATTEAQEAVDLSDSTACVKSAEVVYVNLDAMFQSSKLFEAEGKPLDEKVKAYQDKAMKAQEDLAKREQGLIYEQQKIQQDGAKLNSDYQKGLITTLNAQTKGQEIERRAKNLEANMAALQKSVQQEGEKLQKEEQQLAEESAVLQNRFADLMQRAIKNINADGRYKMIINSMMVVDSADGLDISSLVLAEIDKLYEADK